MIPPSTLPGSGAVGGSYREKTVLVTGHNGFVGSWLCHWLVKEGADVVGISLPRQPGGLADVTGLDSLVTAYEIDIRDLAAIRRIVSQHRPEFVFHLAAQALVLPSYDDPIETFDVNVMGTANLLQSLRDEPSVRACVVITSDKCYADGEGAHKEDDPLGGNDPYSASKAAAEIVAHSLRFSFLARQGVGVATARAGNIVGGGDWGPQRIVPDCIRAAGAGEHLELRHPHAIRPWQHVLDAVAGYLHLGLKLADDPDAISRAWNFGPDAAASATVGDLVRLLLAQWGELSGKPALAPIHAEMATLHERAVLTLDSSLARLQLGWNPRLSLHDTVKLTAKWYWSSLQDGGADTRSATLEQIGQYQAQ